MIELTFKTPFYAMEALDLLKSIRDDIIVRMFETDESATSRWSAIGYLNMDVDINSNQT